MEIRRISETALPAAARRTGGPASDGAPAESSGREGDAYYPQPHAEPPFWLVCMSADRLARRQYLAPERRRMLAEREQAWIKALVEAAGPALAAWLETHRRGTDLAGFQQLATLLCDAAGDFPVPRLVHQPAMREDRGQFLFRLQGNLIQLRPGAPGSHADWRGTIAHETFHHLQQELVCRLYRGDGFADPLLADLAAYYRDARAVYQTLGPHCPAERHRRQALERGAWAFGTAIAAI